MSAFRALVFAAAALSGCCSASADALDTLGACATNAPVQARGIAALESECPGLELALHELDLVRYLPEGWRDALDSDALGDLGELKRRYQGTQLQGAPDPAALGAILDQLAREQVKPDRSWWEVVREWLRSWFASEDQKSTSWLEKLLNRLSESAHLITVISYLLLGLVAVAALAFIVNELRIAGVLSRRREIPPARDSAAEPRTGHAVPGIDDLDSAALRDQPAILLRLLVARLMTSGQLRAERSLTHHELVVRSGFTDSQSRARFAQVAQLAERMLYGAGEADADQASAVIRDGRNLLLQMPTGASP